MTLLTTRDGTHLYYDDWGTGRPIILLGTAMLNARMWEFQAPYLAENGLRCITYDRRGCGRSEWPWTGYDYDTLADDLADLIDFLDLTEVTLVGYAVGGGEAVRYLSRHGDAKIDKLVLVSSTTPFMMKSAGNPDGLDIELFDAMTADMVKDRAKWMGELAVAFFGGPQADREDPSISAELARWMVNAALDTSPKAALEIYRTLFTSDQREETAKVSVPTLIIHGDADMGAPFGLCARKTAELLPDAELVTYPGAAHGLFATHADRLNQDLLAFAQSLPGD